MQLRALDWDTDGPFQAFPVVTIRHPKDAPPTATPAKRSNAFATVGYAGDVGAITGYSAAGIGISEKVWLHYAGSFSYAGAPTVGTHVRINAGIALSTLVILDRLMENRGSFQVFVLRDILQFGTSLADAIAGVDAAPRTNSIFIGVGSQADKQFRALECERPPNTEPNTLCVYIPPMPSVS